jgi:Protein of unknown function (DUF1207)
MKPIDTKPPLACLQPTHRPTPAVVDSTVRHPGRLNAAARILMAAAMVMLLPWAGAAAAAGAPEPPAGNDPGGVSAASGWQITFGPGGHLYPVAIANPVRPRFGILQAWFNDSDIPDAGDERSIISLGGRLGFLRFSPADKPDRGFQLDVEAGFQGVFDHDQSLDNIGWDGFYGVLLSWSNGAGLAGQTGIKHDSSHVGDEYAERTGRTRINYTRGEYVLGLSLAGRTLWRIYGEGGYAYDRRNKQLQAPWRLEAGLEFQDPQRFWGGRFGWYAAADFTWYEESDWSTDVTIQAGLMVARKALFRKFRLGLEYRTGRSVLGEFFRSDETYLALGLWCDF